MPLTERLPKSLLDVGPFPLIDWELATLAAAGIDEVVLVTGHGGSELRAHLAARPHHPAIYIVENEKYAEYNLDYSIFLALAETGTDGFIYIEGDLLIAPDIVRRVASATSRNAIAADAAIPSPRPDSLVLGRGAKATGILFAEHGDLSHHGRTDVLGEFICLGKFSAESASLIHESLGRTNFVGPMQLYQVFERIFATAETECVLAEGQPWCEIDNLADLDAARAMAATKASWLAVPESSIA